MQELSGLRVNDPIEAVGLKHWRDRRAEDGSRPGLAFVGGTQDRQVLLFGGLASCETRALQAVESVDYPRLRYINRDPVRCPSQVE